jgi:hypothetical protein
MQVDTRPFSVNMIDLARKKVLVRPEVADKGNDTTSLLAILARPIYHKKRLLRKLRIEILTSLEALGGKLNRATEQSSLTRGDSSIMNCPTPTRGWSGAHADGPADSRDSPPMGRGIILHTKQGRKRKGKANITHIVGWSKPALLLMNCSPNMLTRRSFYAIGQQRNPSHPLKHNGWIKWPERWHTNHHLFIQWCQDTFHLPTHRRYIVLFKCGTVRRWTHGTCIVPLPIQAWGALPLYIFW